MKKKIREFITQQDGKSLSTTVVTTTDMVRVDDVIRFLLEYEARTSKANELYREGKYSPLDQAEESAGAGSGLAYALYTLMRTYGIDKQGVER